jgi:hypothetical protein
MGSYTKGAIMSEETTATTEQVPDQVAETLAIVKEAQAKGVFNLSEVIKGRGFPTKDVTIYLDAEAAFDLAQINEELNSYLDVDYQKELEAKAKVLADKILKSALTFTMRGVSQKIVDKVMAEANEKYPRDDANGNNPEWVKFYVSSLVAQNIIRVTDAEGNIDEHLFTVEEMYALREDLTRDAWDVLADTMQKLTLASGYFEQLTDAGFLPKS